MTNLPKPISITKDKVVLSRSAWNDLIETLENAEDGAAVRVSRESAKSGVDNGLPATLYRRMRAGEHPVRVWRTYRKLGLNALAEKASVARSYLSEIESGKKPGSAVALQRIAQALDVEMDELMPTRRRTAQS
jgi:DNA-binding Xre family transcriptional regulator